ncbi:MAG TPA: hypothetical protein VIU13_10780 [Chryseolinea sp.]
MPNLLFDSVVQRIKPSAQKVKMTGCKRNPPDPIGVFFAFSAGIPFAIFALSCICSFAGYVCVNRACFLAPKNNELLHWRRRECYSTIASAKIAEKASKLFTVDLSMVAITSISKLCAKGMGIANEIKTGEFEGEGSARRLVRYFKHASIH